MGDAEGEHEAAALIDDTGLCRCESESEIWAHAPIQGQLTHITPPGQTLTAPTRNLAFFVHLCLSTLQGPKYASKRLSISLNFMSLTPPPKAKLSNKAPLQGPLGPCLPPRSSGSSVVGLEVSSGAQNPVSLFILTQPSSQHRFAPQSHSV